jgi:uncharacterized protein YndB with AHSA1/START domain
MSTNRPSFKDGSIQEVDGRHALHFERRLAHPIERVWDALTRPEQLNQWFGEAEIELELVEGGTFNKRTTGPPELVEGIIEVGGEEALVSNDTVLRVEPPKLFEHTFGSVSTSIVRWELEEDDGGCVLTLTHTEPPEFSTDDAPRDLAGWHTLLENLGEALDGRPAGWSMSLWKKRHDHYAASIGSIR